MEALHQALGMNEEEFKVYYLSFKKMTINLGFSEEQFFEIFRETVNRAVSSLK
jgi:hypothetical protein